ncbi:LysR family transcriptional regulator [Xinfangfangia sp. D13-10-4-6]|uniref:LysR family transcriptional regulator n=1 Tax=Pseudogemmobacter hezensis TaxID=2737662 RepID=UPI001554ACB3|nr:LysR family transcriptional regulator [Pseudogemmobacter hezensis]NPD16354.1 LysR family transcriptional regulator [Pseudogemmobacter hezensis]
MDILDCIRAFVATVETGSFTGAAERLAISNRLTSKYVAALEERLGNRLLQRTTRSVGLTAAGQEFYARAPALIEELDDLLSSATENSSQLSGHIRITAPVDFGSVYIKGMLARFLAANPGVTVDLQLDDRYVDLARRGIDLAFRIGEQDQQSLRLRRLGQIRSCAVAAPSYLAGRSMPQTPADLADHDCIIDTNRRDPLRWRFERDGSVQQVTVQGRFSVNSARVAVELAIEGLGVAFCPTFAVGDDLRSGRLLRLLPDYEPPCVTLNVVYLEGRVMPRKLRALIDFTLADLHHAGLDKA